MSCVCVDKGKSAREEKRGEGEGKGKGKEEEGWISRWTKTKVREGEGLQNGMEGRNVP
jgi:hypothetical protein